MWRRYLASMSLTWLKAGFAALLVSASAVAMGATRPPD
jgi:hypothetical protein